ncbi:MAG TPA: hypothetical protein VF729_05640, partial [Solirubrobacterales bacterium]
MPDLVPTFAGTFSPKQMPAREYVPVTTNIFGKIRTGGDTHPSALREADLTVDNHLKLNVKGLPVCRAKQLEDRGSAAAVRACGETIVGGGESYFEIDFPEQKPLIANPSITVFNGGKRDGKFKLLIHTFISVPRPAPIIAVATIERRGSELRSTVRIPVVADGAGSLIDFKLRLG